MKRLSNSGRIGIESIVALAVLLAIAAGIWKFYASYVETERKTKLAEMQAKEAAERRIQDEQDAALKLMREQADAARLKQVQDAREAAAREKVAQQESEALLARRALDKAASEKLRAEELAKAESMRGASADQKARDSLAAQERAVQERTAKHRADMAGRFSGIMATIQNYETSLANATAERAKAQKDVVTFKNIALGAQDKVNGYKATIALYENSNTQNTTEYNIVVQRLQHADDELTRENKHISDLEAKVQDKDDEIARLNMQIKTAKESLASLPVTPAEMNELRNSNAADTPAAKPTAAPATKPKTAATTAGSVSVPKPSTPTLSKVNGRIIHTNSGQDILAQSLMILGDEIRYKDAAGSWQTIPKTDVKSVD
jgi:hypothetical protein